MNEQKAFTIMMKDIEVMRVDFAALIYEVHSLSYKGEIAAIDKPCKYEISV